MEIDPDESPLVINFEDGNRMAALLAEVEPESKPAESVESGANTNAASAAASSSTFSR
jgi:hypothetical protein